MDRILSVSLKPCLPLTVLKAENKLTDLDRHKLTRRRVGTTLAVILRGVLLKKSAWFLASVLMASTALAGSWEGVESVEDGVLHIRNTETPQTVPGNFALTELWRRGDDDDDLIFEIGRAHV